MGEQIPHALPFSSSSLKLPPIKFLGWPVIYLDWLKITVKIDGIIIVLHFWRLNMEKALLKATEVAEMMQLSKGMVVQDPPPFQP